MVDKRIKAIAETALRIIEELSHEVDHEDFYAGVIGVEPDADGTEALTIDLTTSRDPGETDPVITLHVDTGLFSEPDKQIKQELRRPVHNALADISDFVKEDHGGYLASAPKGKNLH